MSAKDVINAVYEQVLRRNPNEPEFHQAVKEVLDSLPPVIDKHPEYVEYKILAHDALYIDIARCLRLEDIKRAGSGRYRG